MAGCVAALIFSSAAARASDNLDQEQIHSELDDHGSWVEVAEHGPAWRPDDVDSAWRPYTRGHWERQDDAWLWMSDLSWGRIPFHYGRWLHHANYGWVWVPGRTWAPAWVAWSEVEGYSAWAPLPPGPVWRGNAFVGAIPASAWCFAPASLFGGTYVYFRPYSQAGWVPRLRPYRGWGPHFRRWSYPRRYSAWGRTWPRQRWNRATPVVRYRDGRRVRTTQRVDRRYDRRQNRRYDRRPDRQGRRYDRRQDRRYDRRQDRRYDRRAPVQRDHRRRTAVKTTSVRKSKVWRKSRDGGRSLPRYRSKDRRSVRRTDRRRSGGGRSRDRSRRHRL